MASSSRPRVYADADVYLHVLLEQEHAEICSSLLSAAQRGDIQLIASRFLTVEIGAWKDSQPGVEKVAAFVEKFLDGTGAEWVEVDYIAGKQANEVAWEHKLRAGDSLHLATALRRKADYFMTYDKRFPLDTVVASTHVGNPHMVWQPTLVD